MHASTVFFLFPIAITSSSLSMYKSIFFYYHVAAYGLPIRGLNLEPQYINEFAPTPVAVLSRPLDVKRTTTVTPGGTFAKISYIFEWPEPKNPPPDFKSNTTEEEKKKKLQSWQL